MREAGKYSLSLARIIHEAIDKWRSQLVSQRFFKFVRIFARYFHGSGNVLWKQGTSQLR
jgi:hypothetical protein